MASLEFEQCVPSVAASRHGKFLSETLEASRFAHLYEISRPSVGPLGVYKISNLEVHNDVLPRLNGRLIDRSELVPEYLRTVDAEQYRPLTGNPFVIREPTIFAVAPSVIGYGHWWIDILPRLWILRKSKIKKSIDRVFTPSYTPEFGRMLMDLFGFGNNIIEVDVSTTVTVLKNAFVPTLIHNDYTFHSVFSEFISDVRRMLGVHVTNDRTNRLFVSRSGYHDRSTGPRRGLENEAEVRFVLEKIGFRTIYNEDLSLNEKIRLYSSASIICGEAGAALEHAMFMPSGGRIVSLGMVNDVQCQLAKVLGHTIAFVATEGRPALGRVNLTADIIGLKSALKANGLDF